MTKTAITYGTFDLFHIGHLRLLQRLDQLADRLIVGVSTDEFNALKGKKCTIPFAHRAEIVEHLRFVDAVFPENDWEQKRSDVLKYKADIFAMGDDWVGEFDELNDICEVIYLPRTPEISSSGLKLSLSQAK